ncbi:unnamed protein product [Owenia fusiformis]|nr:unnamed protein product [Owenia fusiformis]
MSLMKKVLCVGTNTVAVLIVSLWLPIVSYGMRLLSPVRRGFWCDDETIRYPFSRHGTVSTGMLFGCGIGIPIGFILLNEMIRYAFRRPYPCGTPCMKLQITTTGRVIGIFMFGSLLTLTITDIMKMSSGRLRPCFLYMCRPNVNLANCTGFITDYECENKSPWVAEMRKSFPSGHASFAMYSMMFLVLYIEKRIPFSVGYLSKIILQSVCLILAVFTGLSRTVDHMHHWEDVVVGLLLGAVIVFALKQTIPRLFDFNNDNKDALYSPMDNVNPDIGLNVGKSSSQEPTNIQGSRMSNYRQRSV